MTNSIIIILMQVLAVPLLSPLFIGFTRKIKARFQNRVGASVFQPYFDLLKLFNKDEVQSRDASWIFNFTPYLLFATTIIIGFSIPLITTSFVNIYTSDFLVVVYLIALGTFFLALSGLDVGGAFGGFGSSREMMVSSLTEGGLLFSIFALALVADTTNLFAIGGAVTELSFSHFAPVALAFIAFFIALLSETSRFPFDNPATHLELTMIHEAMILEYSGKKLALVEWSSANKYMIFLILGANLFFPWGIGSSIAVSSLFASLIISIGKALILAFAVAVIESTIAKLRIFRLPDLLFTSFVIGMIAIVLVA